MIVDLEDWAFANIARQVEAKLSDRFEFSVVPIAIVGDVARVWMLCEHADLIHFFWREDLRLTYDREFPDRVESKGIAFRYFESRFLAQKPRTTAVYDHLFLDEGNVRFRRDLFNLHCDGYYVCSQRLFDIYADIEDYRRPAAILPDGVSLAAFRPKRLERFDDVENRPITIGWVGNSRWAADLGDPKGLHTIIGPAVEELSREGIPVVTRFADRQVRMIPHREMPDYYAEIDVLLCTSEIEGTPNPVLEAMACGVPVITTDVGVVPQAFGPLQSEFILPARSVDALKTALRRLHSRRCLLRSLSTENLSYIRSWDWPEMAERFAPFFEQALEQGSKLRRISDQVRAA